MLSFCQHDIISIHSKSNFLLTQHQRNTITKLTNKFAGKFFTNTALLVTAMSSGILKAKQKLGRTFNSDKLGGIAFTKISKLTIRSA